MAHLIAVLATDTDLWQHPIRIADSTPVQCGASRTTVQNSDLAGWAGYGYCASHSRRFWGLRLHLVTTVHGLPVAFALTNPTIDERDVLVDLVSLHPGMFGHPDGLILVVDKGYRDGATETNMAQRSQYHRRQARLPQRTTPAGSDVASRRAADHRISQQHPQRPTRTRTPRRANHQRSHRPRAAAHPRPDSVHLAQLAHRPADHAVADRVRPLTLGIDHLGVDQAA